MNAPKLTDAACARVDPELFFPQRGQHTQAQQARAICQGCPEIGPCLEEALAFEGNATRDERYGIRGGRTPRERAGIAKDRRCGAAA